MPRHQQHYFWRARPSILDTVQRHAGPGLRLEGPCLQAHSARDATQRPLPNMRLSDPKSEYKIYASEVKSAS